MACAIQASSMKLPELKKKVYEAWELLSGYRGCVVLPHNFKGEVRKEFGDLRCKDTWIRALARYEALNASHDCLDAHHLILETFNFTKERWDYEYRHLIVDEFLAIPGAVDLIKVGLEALFSEESFTHEERSSAYGFLELVAEKQERGLPTTEFTRRLTAARTP